MNRVEIFLEKIQSNNLLQKKFAIEPERVLENLGLTLVESEQKNNEGKDDNKDSKKNI